MTIADEQRRFYEQLFETHGDDPRALSARDAQTHALPQGDEGWQRLAMFCGGDDPQALKDELRASVARPGAGVDTARAQLLGLYGLLVARVTTK